MTKLQKPGFHCPLFGHPDWEQHQRCPVGQQGGAYIAGANIQSFEKYVFWNRNKGLLYDPLKIMCFEIETKVCCTAVQSFENNFSKLKQRFAMRSSENYVFWNWNKGLLYGPMIFFSNWKKGSPRDPLKIVFLKLKQRFAVWFFENYVFWNG